MKRKFRLFLYAVFVLALPFLAISAVHVGFSQAAYAEISRRGISEENHNAMKHAFAATEFYSLARLVFEPEQAARIVVRLGETNERAERYLKHTTDWSAEVYKDLRNNLTGIAAAEWLYAQEGYVSPCTRLRMVGKLAEDGELAALHTDPRLPVLPNAPDTDTAIAKMKQDEAGLREKLAADIAARGAALREDLGLD